MKYRHNSRLHVGPRQDPREQRRLVGKAWMDRRTQLMNDPAARERQLQKEMDERRLQLERGMAPKRHSTLTREEKIQRGIPLSY